MGRYGVNWNRRRKERFLGTSRQKFQNLEKKTSAKHKNGGFEAAPALPLR
jgi:hypothetical protein